MTEDNHWTLLRDWLLRDWWSPIEACHIFALLIRTEKNGVSGSRAILSEHRQHPDSDLTKKLKVRAEDYFKIWQASKHEPNNDEYYRSSISKEFFTKEYCVKWAQKKSINIPGSRASTAIWPRSGNFLCSLQRRNICSPSAFRNMAIPRRRPGS